MANATRAATPADMLPIVEKGDVDFLVFLHRGAPSWLRRAIETEITKRDAWAEARRAVSEMRHRLERLREGRRAKGN